MPWKFVLVNPDGSQLGELSAATKKTATWSIADAATASFEMDGLLPVTAMVKELQTDLIIYDPQGIKRFRGRMGVSGDQVDTTGHVCTFNAIDYRGALKRRILWDTSTSVYTTSDQGQIAWQLIAENEAIFPGAWGLTQGSGTVTGVLGTFTFTAGSDIASLIDQMATGDNGFEWEIDPELRFNVFSPQRGAATSQVLEYGSTVLAVNPRTLDTSTFANAVRFSGVSTLPAVSAVAPLVGAAGRWETQAGNPNIQDTATLGAQANAALATDAAPGASYSLVLKDGWWTPDTLWLGDSCQIVIKSGRLNVNATDRITQVQVAVGDDGGTVATLSTGIVPLNEAKTTNHILNRLVNLERT